VLIVDDHPIVRRGLRALLLSEDWVLDVTEAATAADGVMAAVTDEVDLVAMDVALPDGDGIEATRRILRARPEVTVLILTMSEDDDDVSRALGAGARGFLLKDTDPETVVDALRAVAGGGLVLGPRIRPDLVTQGRRSSATVPAPFDRLTDREREIVGRLALGESNARIARHLGLSEKTIRNQLSAVFLKLGVGDRVHAALLARDAGIVASP
jgi:two-component system, NarL family, nitrate/nitrite response regulator NarL